MQSIKSFKEDILIEIGIEEKIEIDEIRTGREVIKEQNGCVSQHIFLSKNVMVKLTI